MTKSCWDGTPSIKKISQLLLVMNFAQISLTYLMVVLSSDQKKKLSIISLAEGEDYFKCQNENTNFFSLCNLSLLLYLS